MNLDVGRCLIPDYLDKLGWSQRMLAEKSGVDEKHLSKIILRKIRVASLPVAVLIADALGVTPRDLYEWIPVKETV